MGREPFAVEAVGGGGRMFDLERSNIGGQVMGIGEECREPYILSLQLGYHYGNRMTYA